MPSSPTGWTRSWSGSARGSSCGVSIPHLIDELSHPIGKPAVVDLEHALGVLLARAGEVERAEKDDFVGDRQLRVHEVVDFGLGGPGRRGLRREWELAER